MRQLWRLFEEFHSFFNVNVDLGFSRAVHAWKLDITSCPLVSGSYLFGVLVPEVYMKMGLLGDDFWKTSIFGVVHTFHVTVCSGS